MRRLLIYLKEYKKELVLGPLFKLLEASFELLIPLVVISIIDIGIANHDIHYVIKMCLFMIGLGIIGLISAVTAQFYAAKAAVGFSKKVRHALFAHLQSFSFTELDEVGTSTMITRLTSDINQVQSGINIFLRLSLRSLCIVLGAMIMAFTIDFKTALIFLITIPLLFIVVFGIMFLCIPLYKKVQENLDLVLRATRENLAGVRVIRAFAKEEEEIRGFLDKNQAATMLQLFVGRISALMNPVTYVMINGATVAILWVGAIRVEHGMITQGAVVALVNYMAQILIELIKFANMVIAVTKSIACAKRLQSIFDRKPSMVNVRKKTEKGATNSADEEPLLCFEHVSLTYQNAGAETLSNIHFSVKKGQTIGIIGDTGSGKSSLVHLIPRFYDATKGRILFHGLDIKDYPLKELRSKIGIVMQKPVLFKGTIRENLLWGKEGATEEECLEALRLSQAKEFVDAKKGKLDAKIEQGGKNISGGQKQRLTIARALLRQPEILILDDSASALDFATDAKLRKAISSMDSEMTVFLVSQRTSSIQHADQIVVLDDGEVAGIGTHDELLKKCPIYQEIYQLQYKAKDSPHNGTTQPSFQVTEGKEAR